MRECWQRTYEHCVPDIMIYGHHFSECQSGVVSLCHIRPAPAFLGHSDLDRKVVHTLSFKPEINRFHVMFEMWTVPSLSLAVLLTSDFLRTCFRNFVLSPSDENVNVKTNKNSLLFSDNILIFRWSHFMSSCFNLTSQRKSLELDLEKLITTSREG